MKILAIIFGVSCAFIINVGYAAKVPVKYVQISCSNKAIVKPVKKTPTKLVDKSKSTPVTIKPKHVVKIQHRVTKPSFVMTSGFLLPNLRMFAKKFNYHLIWKVVDVNTGEQMDYRWIGTRKIIGVTSLEILKKMLKPYPIVVNVWKTNKVIEVANTH